MLGSGLHSQKRIRAPVSKMIGLRAPQQKFQGSRAPGTPPLGPCFLQLRNMSFGMAVNTNCTIFKTEGFKWLVHKLVVFTFVAHNVKNPNWPEANQIAILQAWSRIWTLVYQKQIQLAVRARIKYGAPGLQFQGSIPLATLPPPKDLFLVMIYCTFYFTRHQPYELQEEDLNNSWSQKWHFVWVPWFQLSISQDGVTWLPASLPP